MANYRVKAIIRAEVDLGFFQAKSAKAAEDKADNYSLWPDIRADEYEVLEYEVEEG